MSDQDPLLNNDPLLKPDYGGDVPPPAQPTPGIVPAPPVFNVKNFAAKPNLQQVWSDSNQNPANTPPLIGKGSGKNKGKGAGAKGKAAANGAPSNQIPTAPGSLDAPNNPNYDPFGGFSPGLAMQVFATQFLAPYLAQMQGQMRQDNSNFGNIMQQQLAHTPVPPAYQAILGPMMATQQAGNNTLADALGASAASLPAYQDLVTQINNAANQQYMTQQAVLRQTALNQLNAGAMSGAAPAAAPAGAKPGQPTTQQAYTVAGIQ